MNIREIKIDIKKFRSIAEITKDENLRNILIGKAEYGEEIIEKYQEEKRKVKKGKVDE